MRKTAILFAAFIAFLSHESRAAERLVIGGNGQAWDDVGLFFNALEVTEGEGLSPLEADPEALRQRGPPRHGSVHLDIRNRLGDDRVSPDLAEA